MALERLIGCTTEKYFALPYANNSGMKEAHKLLNGTDIARPDFMPSYYFGSALDAILTDPETIATAQMSDADRNRILPMCRALEKDDMYHRLFSHDAGGERQAVFVEYEFECTFDGITVQFPMKVKYDWWNPRKDIKFGGDLKTTQAKSEQQFRAASKWFDYDQQGALYMDVTGSDRFLFIAISTSNHAIFRIPMKRGDAMYESGKKKYLRCASSWWTLNGNVQ